jgi:putative MATE family efflux protein
MTQDSHSIDMLHGPLAGKLVIFALPLAATSLLQQLFNSADAAVAGHFPTEQALAAISNMGPIVNMIVSLFVGLSIGATYTVARYVALDDAQEADDAVHTGMAVSLFSGVLVLFVGVLLAPLILHAMGTPADVIDYAVTYLRIYFLGVPFLLVYNFGAAILRGAGDTMRPLFVLAAGCVINLGLDLLFVNAFGLGIGSLATATAIGYGVSAAIVVWLLCRNPGMLHLDLRRLRIRKTPLLSILRIGLPAGLQGSVFAFSNLIIQSTINGFGAEAMAGSVAANNFEAYSFYVVNSFGQAAVTFTSQNFAVGNRARCKQVFRLSLLLSTCMMFGVDVAFLTFDQQLLRVFTNSDAALHYALIRMSNVLTYQVLVNTYEIPAGAMRGMGWSTTPTLIVIFGTCVLRLVWVFAFFPFFGTFEGLLAVYPISWVFTGAVMLPTYWLVRRHAFKRQEEASG